MIIFYTEIAEKSNVWIYYFKRKEPRKLSSNL